MLNFTIEVIEDMGIHIQEYILNKSSWPLLSVSLSSEINGPGNCGSAFNGVSK